MATYFLRDPTSSRVERSRVASTRAAPYKWAMAMNTAEDARVRMLMASHFRRLANNGSLSSADLLAGVHVDGTRIQVVNPQRGIFKPKQLKHLLSIRTAYPKAALKAKYPSLPLSHHHLPITQHTPKRLIIRPAFFLHDLYNTMNLWPV